VTAAPLIPSLLDPPAPGDTIPGDFACRAVSRASKDGSAVLLDGRLVLFCDRESAVANRYVLVFDREVLTGSISARYAWAMVAALHQTHAG
jgi:hypothetical protein